MADVPSRFNDMGERGEFAPASTSVREPRSEPAPGVHGPSSRYDSGD